METSNANLEEITQALEDIDSLDLGLFNDSFRRSKSSTSIFKDSNVQSDKEMKRKVLFKGDLIFKIAGKDRVEVHD